MVICFLVRLDLAGVLYYFMLDFFKHHNIFISCSQIKKGGLIWLKTVVGLLM